tara:strand:+ start:41 stop:502 length:462 start_codon:yes stop_codon:yes gene_type:complete
MGIPVIGAFIDAGVEMLSNIGGDAIGSFLSDTGNNIISSAQMRERSNNVVAQIGAKNYTEIKKLSRQRAMDKGARNLKKGLRMMPVQRSKDMRQNFKEKTKRHMIEAINNGRGNLALERYKQQLTRMNKDSNISTYAGMIPDDKDSEKAKGVV